MVTSTDQVARNGAAGGVRRVAERDCTAIWLWGEHDLSTIASFGTALLEAASADEHDIVVDLRELTFMDASTIGGLVHGRNLLAGSEARRLYVRRPSDASRRLLERVGLSDLIQADATHRGPASALESWVDVPPSAPGPAVRKPDRSVR